VHPPAPVHRPAPPRAPARVPAPHPPVPTTTATELVLNRATYGHAAARARHPAGRRHCMAEPKLAPASIADLRAQLSPRSIRPHQSMAALPGGVRRQQPKQLSLTQDLQVAHLGRAIWSRRQLSESWSTSGRTTNVPVRPMTPPPRADYDRTVIRQFALGWFEDLLVASPTTGMLSYLTWPTPRVEPNENYARELLEPHTVGVDGYTEQTSKAAKLLSGLRMDYKTKTVAFVPPGTTWARSRSWGSATRTSLRPKGDGGAGLYETLPSTPARRSTPPSSPAVSSAPPGTGLAVRGLPGQRHRDRAGPEGAVRPRSSPRAQGRRRVVRWSTCRGGPPIA
jgi:hypothetical protein